MNLIERKQSFEPPTLASGEIRVANVGNQDPYDCPTTPAIPDEELQRFIHKVVESLARPHSLNGVLDLPALVTNRAQATRFHPPALAIPRK
ncbi:hypothetical protein C8R43DRAFT_1117850 [Mycena crocata]|nr:hypothetical protein C8R43DRAFT_1117850 [Mycena crocata]